jgi:hypothetical protein
VKKDLVIKLRANLGIRADDEKGKGEQGDCTPPRMIYGLFLKPKNHTALIWIPVAPEILKPLQYSGPILHSISLLV